MREKEREIEKARESERERQLEVNGHAGVSLVDYSTHCNTLQHTATTATHCNISGLFSAP